MATFYGTVQGNRGEATRLGHSSLCTSAQSYAGSVIVNMFIANGKEHVRIGVGSGSTGSAQRILYEGPVKALFEDATSFGR